MNKSVKSLANSFKYAFAGLWFAIKNERNMRIHIVATIYVLLFSRFYNLTKTEYALLFLTIALVILCEMLNTAVELTVNIKTSEQNYYAGKAKDVSAGAVLVSAIFAVCIGFALFFDLNIIKEIFNYFKHNIIMLITLIISLIISLVFIFYPTKHKALAEGYERKKKDD
ncbi:MAG: diacylglycerol kinase family protein [Oscillospiraceae bacterium]|nr:diacylglycerol kinase family protein [Oscillospiraceae bacterium]